MAVSVEIWQLKMYRVRPGENSIVLTKLTLPRKFTHQSFHAEITETLALSKSTIDLLTLSNKLPTNEMTTTDHQLITYLPPLARVHTTTILVYLLPTQLLPAQ